jgi:hypothetical protein
MPKKIAPSQKNDEAIIIQTKTAEISFYKHAIHS